MMQYWAGQRERIQAEIEPQIPADRKAIVQLSMPFWKAEAKRLLSILLPFIQQGAEGGVGVHQAVIEPIGIGVDWTLPFTEAADWARRHCGELIDLKGKMSITQTSKDRVARVVANWVESEHTLPQLWKQIAEDPAFDVRRAKLIASTEATRAYAEGELIAGEVLERESVFEYEKHWETIMDDARCPICEGLQYDGTNAAQGVRGMFTSALIGEIEAPPAHPGCRCALAVVPKVPGWEPLE